MDSGAFPAGLLHLSFPPGSRSLCCLGNMAVVIQKVTLRQAGREKKESVI
jgi:hypothetical protein